MRARELAAVALLATTAIGWMVDRALAAPPAPPKHEVPLSAPAKACVLTAVDCSNAADQPEEVRCSAIALAAGNTVVVKSRESKGRYLVIVWRDACK